MACAGDDGSWVELRCGPGCPEPEPSRFSSCHADVEKMLLEAQLETESGNSALLTLGSPAWDDDRASQASEQPGEGELLPPHSQPQLGCPHPRQVREPAPCAAPCARAGRAMASPAPCLLAGCARGSRVEGAMPTSIPQLDLCPPPSASVSKPVLWSLQGGAVGRKKRLFSSELLLLFIPSLLLSHVLTLGLGIYIGKRLAASSANPL
ncbi:BCL2/adenovirus E1B 19 kDa protein-interacting protein 3-like [Chroicocephalus ridibundus]|uniref:BCL2/adenovirus E1B 19 kDa protein-interacting protein 3-like n=1 Tax=Chroicocephalus ridibundus TaxID=1192867 RepID=UPI002FDCA74C